MMNKILWIKLKMSASLGWSLDLCAVALHATSLPGDRTGLSDVAAHFSRIMCNPVMTLSIDYLKAISAYC